MMLVQVGKDKLGPAPVEVGDMVDDLVVPHAFAVHPYPRHSRAPFPDTGDAVQEMDGEHMAFVALKACPAVIVPLEFPQRIETEHVRALFAGPDLGKGFPSLCPVPPKVKPPLRHDKENHPVFRHHVRERAGAGFAERGAPFPAENHDLPLQMAVEESPVFPVLDPVQDIPFQIKQFFEMIFLHVVFVKFWLKQA